MQHAEGDGPGPMGQCRRRNLLGGQIGAEVHGPPPGVRRGHRRHEGAQFMSLAGRRGGDEDGGEFGGSLVEVKTAEERPDDVGGHVFLDDPQPA